MDFDVDDEAMIRKAKEAFASAVPRPKVLEGVRKYRSIEELKADRDRRIVDWSLAREANR